MPLTRIELVSPVPETGALSIKLQRHSPFSLSGGLRPAEAETNLACARTSFGEAKAEGRGFEPLSPYGPSLSRRLHYHSANPPRYEQYTGNNYKLPS